MAVGGLWYSPRLFGRLWWHYQFPGRKFGEGGAATSCLFPIVVTAVVLAVQNTILGLLINALLGRVGPCAFYSPPLCAAALAVIMACASLPHYLFAGKPLPLYLICSGHDAAQITVAVFNIYILA